jgi:acyl-CoA thioesterase FadM
MPADKWIETYRGTVFRWEVDDNDHFTVAYYLARIGDASVAMLHALGTDPAPTVDCFIRYQHELRTGDIMHIDSAVIAVDADGVVLGHKLFESAAGELCTTVEQRIAVSVESKARREMEARRVAWDGPARDVRPRPRTLDGFRDSSRDTVKPWEIDLTGHLSLSAAVHRFTASNAHVLATFGVTPADASAASHSRRAPSPSPRDSSARAINSRLAPSSGRVAITPRAMASASSNSPRFHNSSAAGSGSS